MGISLIFIWLFLQLAVFFTQGNSEEEKTSKCFDYSVNQCKNGNSTKYHCIGLWHSDTSSNVMPQVPCKTVNVQCLWSRYPVVTLENLDRVRVDFKTCQDAIAHDGTHEYGYNSNKESYSQDHVSFPRVSFLCLAVAHEETHEYGYNSNEETYSQGNDMWSEMEKHYVQAKRVPCESSIASSTSSSSYTAEFQSNSIIVDLKDMMLIFRTAIQVSQAAGNASINYTISISPDGINWEPILEKGKLLIIDSSVNDGYFCLTNYRRLYGKLIKFKLYTGENDLSLNVSIDMDLKKGNSKNYWNTPSGSQGCFKFSQPYEGIFHSGLTISHSVNLDYCLAHCSILSFIKALVINGVHCVCTNRTNFGNRIYSTRICNSPKPINNEPAAFLFNRIYPVTASVLSFPSKVILHNSFSFRDINSKRKLTVFYDLGDGNVGKTCTSTLQRYSYLGTFNVSFNIFDELGGNFTTTGQITVVDPPSSPYALCPSYAALNANFSCQMNLSRGSNVNVTVEYGDGTIKQSKAPDSFYYELGEDPNGATEATGSEAVAFVGYPIKDRGKLLGIELTRATEQSMRIMILRKPALPSSIMVDQSNQDPRRTQCSNAEMFDFDNQSCCTSGIDCQPSKVTQDLTGYKFQYIRYIYPSHWSITGPMTKFKSFNLDVIEGDIIVVQPYYSQSNYYSAGRLAKLNKARSTITALLFSTLSNIREGGTFQSSAVPVATRDLYAFRAIVVSKTSHEMKHSYTKVGSFVIDINLQSPGTALMTVLRKPIVVQEKVHSVNISIPNRGLVNRISLFNIEAFGTDLMMVVSFGDGVTRTWSNIEPIQHQYTKKGVFNVTIQIYNKVSWYWVECQYETIMPVKDLWIGRCRQGFVYQPLVFIKSILHGGDYVNISTKFSNGGEEHFVSNISVISDPFIKRINHSFPHPGAYNVTAFATNGLSNETVECTLFVEIPIQGLDMSNISSSINAAHNISLSLAAQAGSNFTYNGTLNGKPIDNIRCANNNCSQAEVLLLAETYPIGKNTLTVCVHNHVTLALCRTANFNALHIVRGTSLLVENAYSKRIFIVNQGIDVSVVFQNGSDVTCFLDIQGLQGMLQECKAGFVMTNSVTCVTSGFFKVLANCSNALNFEYRESNFSCLYPVRQTVLTSDSPQSIVKGTVNFTLSHIVPVPSNATCHVNFGDSVKTVFEDCVLPMNFSHKYIAEGDYLVNVSVYNKLTSNWSLTLAKIEEPVEVIILEIERSTCDPMYGKPAGGPLKNMFPVECPMIFKIVRMDGTRPNVEWNFGDNQIQIMNHSIHTQIHTCAQEGLYNFTIKAFNKISSLSSHLVYECRPSIKCTLYEDSPFLTYETANITLHIENTDFLTAVLIDFGDGEFQVVGASARKNDFPGFPYKVMEPMIGDITVTHLFAKEGEFRVDCNATNAVSHHEYIKTNVVSLHKPCRKPKVKILSVGAFANMSHVRNETRERDLIILTHNVVDCIASRETIFQWKVYLHHGSELPDTLLDHPLWKLNNSKLIIAKQTLPIGIIRTEFFLRMVHPIVDGVLGRADGFITISPSLPKVFIPGGSRRSEDVNGLKTISADFVDFDAPPGNITNVKWVWLVKKDNESLPSIDITNLKNLENATLVDGCFGYGTGVLPFSLSSFEYNSSLITTRRTCHLEVYATREQRTAKYQQKIEFFPIFPLPKLIMVCKFNCEKFNPVEVLSYEGLSLNIDFTELNFEWQLWSEGEMIDLNGKTLSSHLSRNFVLASGMLEGGKNYRLILFAWGEGNEENKGFMETTFKTNNFPHGGECVINPSIGYAVTTPFRVNCSGWIDEDQPITYRVTIDSEIERFMFSGREVNQSIYLPYHHSDNKSHTSSLNLKIYIIDSHGNYNVTTVSAQIQTFEDASKSINEVIKQNGDLPNEILGGNTQSASQLLSSIASVFIHLADEAGNDTETLKNIAERLEYFIDIATQIPCQLPEDVLAIAESLVELTVKPDLLTHNVLGQTTEIFDKMLNVLLETKKFTSVELIEMASTNILTGIGSTLMSSSMHLGESMSTDSSATGLSTNEAKKTTSSLLSSLGKIFSLLRDNLLVGQNYTLVDTPHLALLTGVKSIEELNSSSLGLKDSSFTLPDMQSELNISSPHFTTVIEMFSSTSNPFLWTPTSNAVTTDVISLGLGSKSGESLKVGNLTQKIQVVIKNHNSESKAATTLQVYSSQGNDVSTHRLNVTTNDSSIHGAVHPINCSVPLRLTIRRNEYDCSNDYDYMWTLPRNDTPSEIDPYSFFISNVQFNRTAAGVYYICVKPMLDGSVRENCSGYLNYTISTFSGSCRYWDVEEDAWKGNGCEVGEQTSPAETYCLCGHLTSFGGGMFVAPNPIDFGKALAGFSDLASNPTVFAVIMSMFALYLIAVIFARRADLKDKRKAGVTKLPGNDHRDTFSYEITVYTGLNQSAGTTADVYLRLTGTLGDSEPRLLKDPEVARFQRGAIDKFLLTSPRSLGSLREIHIWHNNAGKSPGWFFFRMQVRDCQTQKKWWFVGNKWLAIDEDDGMVERRIKTATQSDLTQFNILFINATRRNLFDGHLWLSVYTRPVQSTFTRVQRLSCCLSLLLSTMLANAMFFEVGGGTQDTTVKLGPIQLSWSLIMIGIQSSIIVMPVNVLLVTIFRKLAPKQQKTKEYEEDAEIESNAEKVLESEQDKKDEMEEPKDNTTEDSSNTKKKKFLFPYWCIYVAYILCFVSCLTCAFFTLLYGFTFGKEKSEKWLSAMAISFFQSVVVIQPFKVFLLGLFFALIIKDPNKEEEELEADYEPGEETSQDLSLTKENYTTKMALYDKPIKKEKLERARALRMKEKQMSAIIREIFLHFLVVIIVLFVAYGNHDDKSFSYSKRAIDILTKGIPAFTKILNDHYFWDWTKTKLVPNLYPVDSLIGYPYTDIMHNKKTSNMVGVGRLRQLRNKKHTCKVPLVFMGEFEDCTEDYTWTNEETKHFTPGWIPKNYSLTNTSLIMKKTKKTPWDYTSAWEIKGFPYFGKMTTYRGGGYIMELGPTNDTAFQTLHELSTNNWIDQYTRAILTEINIYNVDVNLLCVITLIYEFLPSGSGIPSINVQTIKLYRYLSSVAKAVMGFEIIFFFLVFYWIYRDCKKITREGKQYWKSFWNVIDSLITSLSICSFGIYIARLVFANKAIDQFHHNRHKYVSFQYLVLLNEVLNFLTASVVMLCTIKFLRLLRFNRKISMLSDTLRYASNMIISFFFMIFLVIFAFCAMANLLFGPVLEEYRTLIRSMVSLFSMMLGEFNFENLNDAHRIIGPMMFFFFMVFVQFILVNMFIGILSDSFNMVRTDAAKQSNEYEIVEFMAKKMSSLIGLSKVPIKPDYTWPKTSLEMQVETIDEKTDVIMDYMGNMSDEDLRTAIWLESDKFTDKKDKIILFALGMQKRDFENDDLFDGIPVLLTKLDKMNKKDLLQLSKKDNLSVEDLSSKYGSHYSLSSFDHDNDDSSVMTDSDSEDDRSFSEVNLMNRGDKLQEGRKSGENRRSDSQERRKSIPKKTGV